MATKEEVQADLAEIKTEVAETRGAANSAIVLLREYIDRVGQAAASAVDLDGFRADLALIKDEMQATEAELKAAVTQTPGPTP